MHGIILFFLGLFLAGPSGGGEASNLYPVAVLTETPAGPAFYTGMNVVFSSGSSYDPDGYVVQSKFYINGVLQQTSPNTDTYSTCFALHDYPQAGCYAMASGATTVTLKLEVKDNSGYSRSVSKEYVIKESRSKRYFIKDHLGSVRATVDELGTVIGYDDYYPFGLTMPGRSSNTGNPNDNYKFTSHELDNEANLNLYYAGARYLDPVLGRWLSVDPYAAKFPNLSPYNYSFNNPMRFMDPDGRAPVGCPPCFSFSSNSGVSSVMNLMLHMKAFSGDQQAQEALKYSYKTTGELAITAVSEPVDWALTGYDAIQNGPEWYHAAGLLPLVSGKAARTTAKAFDNFRSFTRSNFRENLTRLTGDIPSGAQAHHVLPNKFAGDFEKAGINIHDPKYGSWWEQSDHLSNASDYNKQWADFFQRNENPTVEQIENFGKRLADEYGFEINY